MKQIIKKLAFLLILTLAYGCGVRGDPIPPEENSGIGSKGHLQKTAMFCKNSNTKEEGQCEQGI